MHLKTECLAMLNKFLDQDIDVNLFYNKWGDIDTVVLTRNDEKQLEEDKE